MNFTVLQSALNKHFQTMSERTLYATTTGKDELWETYLASFPVGTNPIYRQRTEHDCSCCRGFIKKLGGVVNIVAGQVVTLWDFQVGEGYQPVVDALAALVRRHAIENVFLHPHQMVGTPRNRELLADQSVKTWDHFYANLPVKAIRMGEQIGPLLSTARADHDVLRRGLEEITYDAIATVMELIAQGSLYRGQEHEGLLNEFMKLKRRWDGVVTAGSDRDLFAWSLVSPGASSAVARFRNSVIGTLVVDLSEGKELEESVRSFESKVAPANYKRPTALVTKAMIARAQETVDALGLASALERRYAVAEDISVADIIFASRSSQTKQAAGTAAGAFAELSASVQADTKKLSKVEEIHITDFLKNVLPKAQSVEVLLENRHAGNLVSLIAPVDATANRLFKWDNGFSWSYVGDFSDSIKEKVKRAGGSVTGDVRASLAWYNYDDLDIHLTGPRGMHIFFRDRNHSLSRGQLDVDMNAGSGTTRTPVENITFPDRRNMPEGGYHLYVNNFKNREYKDLGFDVELEFGGTVHHFAYNKPVKTGEEVSVCRFMYSHAKGLQITESLPSSQTSKTVWNLPTQVFHPVTMVMLSPNYWGNNAIGNQHYFFMLSGCRNDGVARGFFNEFLHESLTPHRKVLEMVGARMKTDKSESQLSGLGFSSTQRNELLVKVTGAFTRTVKVLI